MWNCPNCGATVDEDFLECNVCGEMRVRQLPSDDSPPTGETPTSEALEPPLGEDLAKAFVPQVEPPVASPLAAWVWIIAVFAFFPVLGVLPAVVLAVLSAVLLLQPSELAWDRRIGVAGLAIALLALGITALWIVMLVLAPPQLAEFPQKFDPPERIWWVTAMQVVVLIFSIVLHEIAHGVSALWSGDGTAARLGRLKLNPLVHVDVFGSIILPAILLVTPVGFVLGWAKPVPVNSRQFRHHRRGLLAVTLAGVSINLLLALMCTAGLVAVGSALRIAYPQGTSQGFMMIFDMKVTLQGVENAAAWELVITGLKQGLLINLVLFSFNIIPIPPLDGFGVLESLAPSSLMPLVSSLRSAGFFLLLILVISGLLQYALIPGILFGLILNASAGFMTGWS
jgi:Zn-dependent protease